MKHLYFLFILSFVNNLLYANSINTSLISFNISDRYSSGEIKTCFENFKKEKLFKLKYKDSNLFRMLTLNDQKIIITIKGKEKPYVKLKRQSAMPFEIILPDLGKNWCNEKAQENTIYYLKQNLLEKLTERMLTFMDEASDAIKASPTLICSDESTYDLIQKHFNDIKYHEVQDYIVFPNGYKQQLSSFPNAIEDTLRTYFFDLRATGRIDHILNGGMFKDSEGLVTVESGSSGLKIRDTQGEIHTMPTTNPSSFQNCNYRYRRTKQGLKERQLFNCEKSSFRLRTMKPFECRSCSEVGKKILENEQEIEDSFIKKAKTPSALTSFKTSLKSLTNDKELKMSKIGKEKFLTKTSDLYIKLWIIEDLATRLGISKPQSFYTLKMDLDKARKGQVESISIPDFKVFNELIFK